MDQHSRHSTAYVELASLSPNKSGAARICSCTCGAQPTKQRQCHRFARRCFALTLQPHLPLPMAHPQALVSHRCATRLMPTTRPSTHSWPLAAGRRCWRARHTRCVCVGRVAGCEQQVSSCKLNTQHILISIQYNTSLQHATLTHTGLHLNPGQRSADAPRVRQGHRLCAGEHSLREH